VIGVTRPRWIALVATLALTVAAVTVLALVSYADDAVGGSRGAVAASTTTAAATTSSAPSTSTTTAPRGRRGSGQPVTIAFGGDVHFEKMLRTQLDANATGMLAPLAPILSSADLAVVNLETAITERGTPASKEFTFRAPARAFTALASAGIDVASMANNHGLDYGPDGLADSLAAAAFAHFPVIGIGHDATEAYRPYRTTVKGQRIAIIGATQVLDANLITAWTATDTHAGLASAKDVPRLVTAVHAARATADTVIVFLHWGVEQQTCPSAAQEELGKTLVDAGADIVIGGHAHRLEGGGRLGDAFVGYGLGNFVFYTAGGPGTQSGVVLVTVTGRDVDGYRFVPAQLHNGVATPLTGQAATGAVAQWNGLRSCTNLTP
jgi:poly-gamma-glutamate capsule biosynthesis protein CapA/YwtB (metallophosphatase superfamily)